MIEREKVAQLEASIGSLTGVYNELRELSKKRPNDGLNKFKIGIVNRLIHQLNSLLTETYIPLSSFSGFNEDDIPTNSDVTFVLAQYAEQLERYRADNVRMRNGRWIYDVDDDGEDIWTAPPAKLGK
jgi:hypothetical protein